MTWMQVTNYLLLLAITFLLGRWSGSADRIAQLSELKGRVEATVALVERICK